MLAYVRATIAGFIALTTSSFPHATQLMSPLPLVCTSRLYDGHATNLAISLRSTQERSREGLLQSMNYSPTSNPLRPKLSSLASPIV
jgi:hypothetical protein